MSNATAATRKAIEVEAPLPAASEATGFSQKMCLPLLTAYSNCWGLKPGGVAMTTTSQSTSIAFLYASRPVKVVPWSTLTLSASRFLRPSIAFLQLSSNASATETSLTLPGVLNI